MLWEIGSIKRWLVGAVMVAGALSTSVCTWDVRHSKKGLGTSRCDRCIRIVWPLGKVCVKSLSILLPAFHDAVQLEHASHAFSEMATASSPMRKS